MSRVFEGDVVRRRSPPERLGLVIRSFDDQDGISSFLDPAFKHPDMLEPLSEGEVVVAFDFFGNERGKFKEDDVEVVDRSLRLGEAVKEVGDGVRCGVVIGYDVQMRLGHAISGQKLPGWVGGKDVKWNNRLGVGSYVVHGNWVGQVIDVGIYLNFLLLNLANLQAFDEVYIQMGDGEIQRLGDMSGRLAVGDRGKHILPPLNQDDEFHPQASHEDLVIHIQRLAYAISWLAVNQMLSNAESSNLPRPKQIWSFPELHKLTPLDFISHTPSLEHRVQMADRRYASSKGILPTKHGKDGVGNPSSIEVATMVVKETRTKAKVLWQDASEGSVDSTKLVPNLMTDGVGVDSCPGDHAIWKCDGEERHVVIQSVNATQRTARVLFVDTGKIELVSVLELDTVNPSPPNDDHFAGYGVRVGDLVFIHPDNAPSTSNSIVGPNGYQEPVVPSIGEMDPSMTVVGGSGMWAVGWGITPIKPPLPINQPPQPGTIIAETGAPPHPAPAQPPHTNLPHDHWQVPSWSPSPSPGGGTPGAGGMIGQPPLPPPAGSHSAGLGFGRPLELMGTEWRKSLYEEGQKALEKNVSYYPDLSSGSRLKEGEVKRWPSGVTGNGVGPGPTWGDEKIGWLGEVSKLNLDGSTEVRLPDGTKVTFPLGRLSKLSDPFGGGAFVEDPNADLFDDMMDHADTYYSNMENIEDPFQIPGTLDSIIAQIADQAARRPTRRTQAEEDEDGDVDIEGGGIDEDVTYADADANEFQLRMDLLEYTNAVEERMKSDDVDGDDDVDEMMEIDEEGYQEALMVGGWQGEGLKEGERRQLGGSQHAAQSPNSSFSAAETTSKLEEPPDEQPVPGLIEDENWERFAVLPNAPLDHAFISEKALQPSKGFTNKLGKEFRALRSSLPETILVRAYEDRSDLLRSLIIGPEHTPYQDAPFVIDWYLAPDFPQSPPKAHFHSWTQGNGRVNPNLYEEGKVCLSILGTWSGDHSESWNPAQSSLLQAFVSIQGLVLVKEPWYCEPGFEKQRGTREGIISSRQYSEKAYVLSLSFIRRALEQHPIGLEDELKWFYYTHGRLAKVLQDVRQLVERSSQVPEERFEECLDKAFEESDLAVPLLSQGGIIAASRVIPKLVALAELKEVIPLRAAILG